MSNNEVSGSIRSGAMRSISATSARTISVSAAGQLGRPSSRASRRRKSCADSVQWEPRSPAHERANSENFGAREAGK